MIEKQRCLASVILIASTLLVQHAAADELTVLFLGDNGHHRPRARFEQLQPAFARRAIQIVYADDVADLSAENLARFDVLLLYANIDRIGKPQERALLEFVAGGGGFVPIHCASYCFRNSPEIVALMGAQFRRHGTGIFRTEIAVSDHPIMQRFGGFESWDETYVHHLHNDQNRIVLSYRVDPAGREPWTWVRTHGKGRVFYTAWGHDERTWGHQGFQNLLERGVRWAAGKDLSIVSAYLDDQPFPVPEMTPIAGDLKPFEYVDVGGKIPNYTAGARWGVQGKALSKMQKPVEADESLRHISVPKGFTVKLFASEPDIGGKPICMAWDERGRLWIAETYDYPNELQPTGKGRDRIRILEDSDGDWRADKFTVFAEKLSIPTSIAFHRGGVIVQNGTRTLYLTDKNGDDIADEQTVLFAGWNQGDTHGGVSNFQYGLDNWIWAMQGYNASRPTVQGERQQPFRMGFFRFRPDGSQLEFVRSTNNNTWGLGISEEGIIFGSTANRNPSVYMPIANRYYERVRGWTPSLTLGTIADTYLFKPITTKVRQVDQHGGYTAAAGHALYTARRYPKPYWNRTAFVNGPTGHLVGTFLLRPQGSGFQSSSPFNLFASDDEWTAPIMSEVGPDGNVWVIDWYNYIVQHNPTPRGFKTGRGNAYETDLRDKKHGRIYRVVYGDAEDKPMTLNGASTRKLVETLRHPTMLWRKHAQRLLVERGNDEVVPALIELARDESIDEIGLNVGVIHVLWTLHGLGQLDGSNPAATAAVEAALSHESAGVRRNALKVLPGSPDSTKAILRAGLLQDQHAQVRLAALLAIADLPATAEVGTALFESMTVSPSDDRWLNDAGIAAAASNASGFLRAVAGSEQTPDSRLLQAVATVATHFGRGGPADSVASVLSDLNDAPDEVADAILVGLAKGWPSNKAPKLTDQLTSDLEKLLSRLPAGSRGVLVKLARTWGSSRFESYAREVSQSLLSQLDEPKLADEERLRAARQLVEFRPLDDDVVTALLERISPQTSSGLAVGILQAIGSSEAPTVGKTLVEQFRRLTPAVRLTGISVLLSRPESTGALLAGIDGGIIQLSELTLEQKQALSVHPNTSIRRRARGLLARGGALPNPDRQKVLAELLPIVQEIGDIAAGKAVFKKQCAKCHRHSGEGSNIGPDLTGMAVHPKAELLTHIIDPSRDVEGNFRVYTVATLDGLLVTGLLISESKTAIELVDSEGKKKAILRDDIEQLVASAKSIMPDGFEKQVSRAEIRDLLEFLAERGKFLPVDMAMAATISSARGMFFNKEANVERLVFSDWSPKVFKGVPFHLTDPRDGRVENVILLHGPIGPVSSSMPKTATLPCNGAVRTIHMLGGVSGWGFPYAREKTVSMIVRLHYADGKTEDHELVNGEHFADYIRRVDVPKSEFAFMLRGQQIRYLTVNPQRPIPIESIEFIKGPDQTAPVVMAVTLEGEGR